MKGIIIDGVATSAKTTILKYLHNKIVENNPTIAKFFVSEHYTERMLEHLKESEELDGARIKKHIENIIQALAVFQNMLKQSKFNNNPKGVDSFVALERFILTHMVSLNNIEDKYTIEEAKKFFIKK
jgi:thymidylate kinase